MSEKDQRGRVVRALKRLDALAVENRVHPGTPDVNFIGGWVELKWLRRWPDNCWTDPVRIDHFTPQQRVWLVRRYRRWMEMQELSYNQLTEGMAWLLLQVKTEWLLFDGNTAAKVVGRVNREELIKAALHVWSEGLKDAELRLWLTKLGPLKLASGYSYSADAPVQAK